MHSLALSTNQTVGRADRISAEHHLPTAVTGHQRIASVEPARSTNAGDLN
jgi:hypothetical protein